MKGVQEAKYTPRATWKQAEGAGGDTSISCRPNWVFTALAGVNGMTIDGAKDLSEKPFPSPPLPSPLKDTTAKLAPAGHDHSSCRGAASTPVIILPVCPTPSFRLKVSSSSPSNSWPPLQFICITDAITTAA